MTNKEAIKWLKVEASYIESDIGHGKEILEAYDMAIEALKQEPCEDAISRQAVLDAMRGLTRWCVRSEDGKFNNVGLLYDDVMFGIDKLPPVTPQPITLEKAIDYLHEIGWMQEHDKEMAQPKVGEWLKNGELCKCSNCHSNVLFSAVKHYKYCFNCGTKMEQRWR